MRSCKTLICRVGNKKTERKVDRDLALLDDVVFLPCEGKHGKIKYCSRLYVLKYFSNIFKRRYFNINLYRVMASVLGHLISSKERIKAKLARIYVLCFIENLGCEILCDLNGSVRGRVSSSR